MRRENRRRRAPVRGGVAEARRRRSAPPNGGGGCVQGVRRSEAWAQAAQLANRLLDESCPCALLGLGEVQLGCWRNEVEVDASPCVHGLFDEIPGKRTIGRQSLEHAD